MIAHITAGWKSNSVIWWVSQGEKNLYICGLLLGSSPFKAILLLGQIYFGMKILAWYVYTNGIEIKFHQIFIPCLFQKG